MLSPRELGEEASGFHGVQRIGNLPSWPHILDLRKAIKQWAQSELVAPIGLPSARSREWIGSKESIVPRHLGDCIGQAAEVGISLETGTRFRRAFCYHMASRSGTFEHNRKV